ncbi:DUF2218 domain-containing protein [Pseudooceanicola marinus]|nr:DUF2218 domain-containing protein [Pseudooceanicola marinus]
MCDHFAHKVEVDVTATEGRAALLPVRRPRARMPTGFTCM